MSIATETARIREVFDQVEEIEQVAVTLAADDQRRTRLVRVVDRVLAKTPPVRPVVAGVLLDMTEKTVRAWAREGVLTVSRTEPTVLLEASRLHQVLHLVADLKEAGRTRGLLDEVYRRLSDEALLDRDDLATSLDQMNQGEGLMVRRRAADS